MADDKKYHFANLFSVRFADNDVLLTFGIDEDPSQPGTSVADAVNIVLTPRSAKILSLLLAKTIESFERQSGKIPVPEERIKGIEKLIADIEAAHAAKKATAKKPD